jgi:hypothetical protein
MRALLQAVGWIYAPGLNAESGLDVPITPGKWLAWPMRAGSIATARVQPSFPSRAQVDFRSHACGLCSRTRLPGERLLRLELSLCAAHSLRLRHALRGFDVNCAHRLALISRTHWRHATSSPRVVRAGARAPIERPGHPDACGTQCFAAAVASAADGLRWPACNGAARSPSRAGQPPRACPPSQPLVPSSQAGTSTGPCPRRSSRFVAPCDIPHTTALPWLR